MASSKAAAASSQSPSSPPLLGNYLLLSQPLSSASKTFANLVLCIIGTGVLGLPYTFSTVGWVMGILILALSGAVAYHGMMLLIRAKRRFQRIHGDVTVASYGDLMYYTFGRWGRMVVDVLLALSTIACGISYLTFISQNVASIASAIQGAHISSSTAISMQGTQNLSAIAPSNGLPASTEYGNISTLGFTFQNHRDNHSSFGISHENLTFLGLRHDNNSSLGLSHENQSLLGLSYENQSSLGFGFANLSLFGFSFSHQKLLGFSWISSSTYTWLVFPLEVVLAAIPYITYLAPLSTVADSMNFVALAAVMVSDVLEIRKTSGFQAMRAFGNMEAVPSAFGVGIYAFQSAGMMIPIEIAMEEPCKLGSVLGLALVLSGVLYAVFSVLGYAAFGKDTQQMITLNLQDGLEPMLIKAAISLALFLAFPLMLNPMCELVERRFSNRKLSLGLRAMVVFAICLLASAVKRFADFLSLAGSSISCLLGFILPAALHLKVINEDVEDPPTFLLKAADILLIAFGLLFGAFGTTVSFINLL